MSETDTQKETTGGRCNVRSSDLLGVIGTLRNCDDCYAYSSESYNFALSEAQDRAADMLELAAKLLAVAECPAHCDNGVIPEQIADDEWQPVQCQFCAERSELLTPNARDQVPGDRVAGERSPALRCSASAEKEE